MAGPDVDDVRNFQLDSTASVDLIRFRFVKQVGEHTVIACTVAGEKAIGVAYTPITQIRRDEGTSGGPTTPVVTDGWPLVEVGTGGVAIGQYVATDNVGKAVVAATGNIILGIARKAGAAGDWVPIELVDPVTVSP